MEGVDYMDKISENLLASKQASKQVEKTGLMN